MDNFENSKDITAKGWLLSKLGEMPIEVQKAYADKRLKIVDSVIYSQKCMAGAVTIDLMENSDTASAGVTNLNNRKMEALNYFCVTGVRLLSKTVTPSSSAITQAEINSAALDLPTAFLANGELEIQVGGKVAFPRNSCRCFSAENDKEGKGYMALESPFIITPQTEIVPTLRVATGATTTNEVVRIELIGARMINA